MRSSPEGIRGHFLYSERGFTQNFEAQGTFFGKKFLRIAPDSPGGMVLFGDKKVEKKKVGAVLRVRTLFPCSFLESDQR
jgi:hypothetical protein